MTSTEATNLKAALARVSQAFPAAASVQKYINNWKNDVDAIANGSLNSSDNSANVSENGMLVTTVAALPGSPATNDEVIVTDANALTNGSTVAGGGSNRVLVRYSGSAWQIV